MPVSGPDLSVRFATGAEDILAAQRLRYQVFVAECGGDGTTVDHELQIERDRFDPYCDHLLLMDESRPKSDQIVGAYRLMSQKGAESAGQYYSETEFDLGPLIGSGRKLLELGRTCLRPEYRGGTAMYALWSALARYVDEQDVEILFGAASFSGTDTRALAQPLSYLHHHHLAPPELRVAARGAQAVVIDVIDKTELDRRAAITSTPALIKGYLRIGGFVGQGAWVDRDFNTTDICMLLDTRVRSTRQAIYRSPRGDS